MSEGLLLCGRFKAVSPLGDGGIAAVTVLTKTSDGSDFERQALVWARNRETGESLGLIEQISAVKPGSPLALKVAPRIGKNGKPYLSVYGVA